MPSERHIPDLLAEAIEKSGKSVRGLARELAAQDGTLRESKRRLLLKYLDGTSAPEPPMAERLAELLGKPRDYFVTTTPVRAQRRGIAAAWDQIDEIWALIEELQQRLPKPDAGEDPPQSAEGSR